MLFTRIEPLEVVPQPETVIAWHETPAVAAYLDAIDIDDLFLTRARLVMSTDELIYSGDPVEKLFKMRREVVDALFGFTFAESEAQGHAREYLDFDDAHPSVHAVLADRFGDPRRFGNEDAHRATLMMRADVRLLAAQVRHGLGRAAA